MKHLHETSANVMNESTSYFVYGVCDSRPRSMDKKIVSNHGLQNCKSFSRQQPQEPQERGYVYKYEVKGKPDDKASWIFVSCTYNE